MAQATFYTADFTSALAHVLGPYRGRPAQIMVAGGSILPLFLSVSLESHWTLYISDERMTPPFNITDAHSPLNVRLPGEITHIDLAVLGIGEDGHIASLFPHSPLLMSDERVLNVWDAPKHPNIRVSVGMSVVNSVGKLVFMVPRKDGVVKDVRGPHESIAERINIDYDVYLDSVMENKG